MKREVERKKEGPDRVNSLLLLSKEMIRTNPRESLVIGLAALDLSKKIDYPEGKIDALNNIGFAYKDLGKFDSAAFYCQRAIQHSDSVNDLKRLADNYFLMGNILYRTEGPQKSKNFYTLSLDLYQKLSDSLGIANVYNGLGTVYLAQPLYDSAIFYFHEFIKLSERTGYRDGLGKATVNLGSTYYLLYDYERAKQYLIESIEVNRKLNNKRYIGIAYSNLGNIAYEEKKNDTALDYFRKAKEIYNELGNKYGLTILYSNIGHIYLSEKQYDKAYYQYSEAKKLFKELGDDDGFLAAFINQGLIFERRKNYDKALLVYDSCLKMAQEMNSLNRMRELYKNIYKTYELNNNMNKAFYYQTLYHKLNDSIFNIEKAKVINELEIRYEREKDQAQILSLENDNLEKDLFLQRRTTQRNIYLFAGLGIILIITFSLVNIRLRAGKDKIIASQKIQQLEEEKKLLAAKLVVEGQEEERKRIARELHDGLGVLLSTVKMQFTTLRDKSPENQRIIERATELLELATGDVRRISHNMMPGLLTKFGLFEAVEELVEQVNENENIHAVAEIKGEPKRLRENTEIMIYRIIQEMVNNTLKYAEAKNIHLKIEIEPELLKVDYMDDGKGFDMEEKLKQKSFGLTNIQSRVRFLAGKLEVQSSIGKGVRYTFVVPVT
ncbi:MAG: tetratricopeptide repeat protein [Bacteroidales bacterium]|nr:tetratricopeptide repeat protein [Bacteroidales bacterium]